jgi:flavin-dependent dehydrogenase
MRTHETDVLIVGGGPAGLAAGIAARQKGFTVTVADACRPPIDKACGEGIMADALAALRRLGVHLSPSQGIPFRGIRFVESGFSCDAYFPGESGLGIRRTILHELLVDCASRAGVQLLWGQTVKLDAAGVFIGGVPARARWMIGADGQDSRFRRWAGLDHRRGSSRRFGVRRHFEIEPWTDLVEVYWAAECQAYITPVGAREVCVAIISRDRHLRFEDLFGAFPELGRRFGNARPTSAVRGAVTASCRLRAVAAGHFALIGDASGSMDALTGLGLSLAFHEAHALAGALERNDLELYAAEHRRIAGLPRAMERLMLLMDRHAWLRHVVFRAFRAEPRLFQKLLALHCGLSPATTPAGAALLRYI